MTPHILQLAKNVIMSRTFRITMAALVLASIGASLTWGRLKFKQLYQKNEQEKAEASKKFLEQSQKSVNAGNYEAAFTGLRGAIDSARTPAERADAGFAMGEFLLKRAHEKINPYAQMAQGYLTAAAKLDPAPELKVKIYRALADVGELQKDPVSVISACESGIDATEETAEKVKFLLTAIDATLRIGTGDDMQRLWLETEPFRVLPESKADFDLREAQWLTRVLTSDDWYQSWTQQHDVKTDPIMRRAALLTQALALYDQAARQNPDLLEQCLFRSAQLCTSENQFDEAQKRVRQYFNNNFNIYREDVMLILTRMARLEGNTKKMEDMIAQFMSRFQWKAKAVPELLAVIDHAMEVGHDQEALFYLEEYIKNPEAQSSLSPLRYKAGQIANRLKQYDSALAHYTEALLHTTDDDLRVSILLGQTDVYLQQGNFESAQKCLVRSLTRFPYDARRGKMLYQLIDIFSKSRAPLADVLLVTSLAVDVAPNDPAVADVLMQLARTYEQLGMATEAQDKYAKVALLRTVDSTGKTRTPSAGAVNEALLGSARCLIQLGDTLRADRLLRELCRNGEVNRIQGEAAYRWAMLALREGQTTEAKRRLALIDFNRCTPEIRTRAQLEGMLVEVSQGQRAPQTVAEFLITAPALPEDERLRYQREAYAYAFAKILDTGDIAAIQDFIDAAAFKTGPSALPLSTWAMQLASRVLQQKGAPAFIECVNRNLAHMDKTKDEAGMDAQSLVSLATSLEITKKNVNETLK